MSQGTQHTKTTRDEPQRPLISAADIREVNYPRAWFDEDIAWTIKRTAQQRAPTPGSVWSHQIGFACELATSAYFRVSADWSIYDDYIGDDGHDLTVDGTQVEVKGVTDRSDPTLRVPIDKVDNADQFVLGQCMNPSVGARLIGSITRERFKQLGYRFDGCLCVEPDCLTVLGHKVISPEEIRATQ